MINILFVGDVFGKPGRRALADCLEQLKESRQIELTIANGENAAGGSGTAATFSVSMLPPILTAKLVP